jgi:threonine/homoserine/homoserine lactone efflux protein
MIAYLIQGIGLGFAGAVQPGPFQAYAIAETLKNGWRRSVWISLAPLISDGPIILLVLLVLSRVPPSLQRSLHIVSGLFLLWLAWGAFSNWRVARQRQAIPQDPGGTTMIKAVVMNLISPGPYIYWSLVAGPLFLEAFRSAPHRGIGFLLGFYGTLVGTFGLIIMVFGKARDLGPKVTRALLGASAAALAGFALFQLWRGLMG